MNSLQACSLASAGFALITLGTVGAAEAATLIDTTPSWDKFYGIGPFGESVGLTPLHTFGQTFTVGVDNVLTNFTFFVGNSSDAKNIDMAGYVMSWDGNKATGSILYQSAPRPVFPTTSPTSRYYGEFTFDTGDLALSSGNQYVAFISVANLVKRPYDDAFVGQLNGNPYPGGDLVFLQGKSLDELRNIDVTQLTTSVPWQTHITRGGIRDDAAFKASFVSANKTVPESTSIWGLLGFGCLGAVAKLKKGKGFVGRCK
jgi:hypothetical protein